MKNKDDILCVYRGEEEAGIRKGRGMEEEDEEEEDDEEEEGDTLTSRYVRQ